VTGDVDAREAFCQAARWYRSLVLGLRLDQLDGPGLGEWNLRQLVAHGARALVTVAEYLRPAAPAGTEFADDDPIAAAGSYYLSVRGRAGLHEDVAERGRAEAERLGDALLEEVAALVDRATDRVRQAPAGAVFETRFGVIGSSAYLCTRTVELVVHGVDVAAAAGLEAEVPERAAAVTLAVLAELACQGGDAVTVIGALSGRRRLPEEFGLFM
jgi:uncharacterized protein (TIGR03083 family)